MSFHIITDTSADLDLKFLEENNVAYVPFYLTFDGVNYLREFVDITPKEMYRRMKEDHAFPKTSLPSVQDYIDRMKPALERGEEIVCICISSKFSGSYQSALNAKKILLEDFPNATLLVIDTLQCTGGQGLLLFELLKMRKAGLSASEARDHLERIKDDSLITCTVDSLEYLQKGGRLGKVSAFAGTLLNIKPIIIFTGGELFPRSKVRGRKKAIAEMIDIMLRESEGKREKYEFCIVQSDSAEEAADMQRQFEEAAGVKITAPMFELGSTIGCHIGPTVLGFGMRRRWDS